MADCNFTSDERERIEAISFELARVSEEFFDEVRSELSGSEWELLADYSAACVRRVLQISPLLHAIVDRQCDALPYPGRGRKSFVRAALAAWKDSFAPMEEVWRLAPIFAKAEGGERRVLADIAALEVMAVNGMFQSWDEQCAALLSPKE